MFPSTIKSGAEKPHLLLRFSRKVLKSIKIAEKFCKIYLNFFEITSIKTTISGVECTKIDIQNTV